MQTASSEGDLIRQSLGKLWADLHPDIQTRFSHYPTPPQRLYYAGKLSELFCSKWGKLLAYLLRPLIGGALLPYCDTNFPVDIEVFHKNNHPKSTIFKQRNYKLNKHKNIIFVSKMLMNKKQNYLLEYVGFGLGMALQTSVKNGNLLFESQYYFWDIFGFLIKLPDIFSPGKTHLTHININKNIFQIRIEIRHKLLGLMFVQAGEFEAVIV